MAYTKLGWTNGSGNALNDDNLNYIEDGIEAAAATADSAATTANAAITPGELDARVPDPSGEPDDRFLTTSSGSLVYADAPSGGASDAASVTFDNATSGLSATNVQAAIDEVAASSGGGGAASPTLEIAPGNAAEDAKYERYILGNRGNGYLENSDGSGIPYSGEMYMFLKAHVFATRRDNYTGGRQAATWEMTAHFYNQNGHDNLQSTNVTEIHADNNSSPGHAWTAPAWLHNEIGSRVEINLTDVADAGDADGVEIIAVVEVLRVNGLDAVHFEIG